MTRSLFLFTVSVFKVPSARLKRAGPASTLSSVDWGEGDCSRFSAAGGMYHTPTHSHLFSIPLSLLLLSFSLSHSHTLHSYLCVACNQLFFWLAIFHLQNFLSAFWPFPSLIYSCTFRCLPSSRMLSRFDCICVCVCVCVCMLCASCLLQLFFICLAGQSPTIANKYLM